jgi:CBS domain-containing protein
LYIYKTQCKPNNYLCIMKKVSDILKRKGGSVVTIDAATTVLDALKLMADRNIGSVVISEHGKYLGLMTERDYARKVILLGRSSHETPVREIMSTGLPRIVPETSIETCMHIMSESNIRYLPVFVDDQLSGIVSINDLVTETILSHLETIEHLKTYIQS